MRSQSGPAEFDSHNLEPGQSYSMKLTAKGTYTYLDDRDDENARYFGRIVVGGSSGSATKPSSGGGSTSATPSSASVSMAGRAFSPATVTIAAGGSVTFHNDDDRAHTVTANDGAFDSGTIGEGGSWKWSFEQAGTFAYLCAIHPEMTGKVVVAGAGGSGGAEAAPATTPKSTPSPSATPTTTAAAIVSPPPTPEHSSLPAAAAVPPLEPVASSTPEPASAPVAARAGIANGELMARIGIVGLLVGGALVLFARTVRGSADRGAGGDSPA